MHEVVILAGGLGTRLRAVLPNLPKPMAPVDGKPFLEIQLDYLADQGFRHAILSVGYKSETICDHFGSQYGSVRISYVIEETPHGTGGAVQRCLEAATADVVFVVNGDTFVEVDYDDVRSKWGSPHAGVLVARQVRNAGRYGELIVDGDSIVGVGSTHNSELAFINAGCYMFSRTVMRDVVLEVPFSLETEFLPAELQRRPYRLHQASGIFIDIGVPDDYALAQTLLRDWL